MMHLCMPMHGGNLPVPLNDVVVGARNHQNNTQEVLHNIHQMPRTLPLMRSCNYNRSMHSFVQYYLSSLRARQATRLYTISFNLLMQVRSTHLQQQGECMLIIWALCVPMPTCQVPSKSQERVYHTLCDLKLRQRLHLLKGELCQ
jgi:hypothetical protein